MWNQEGESMAMKVVIIGGVAAGTKVAAKLKIGRASCRERVCLQV